MVYIDVAKLSLHQVFNKLLSRSFTLIKHFNHHLLYLFLQHLVSFKRRRLNIVSHVKQRMENILQTILHRILQIVDRGLQQRLQRLIIDMESRLDTTCVLYDLEDVCVSVVIERGFLVYVVLHVLENFSYLRATRQRGHISLTFNQLPILVHKFVNPPGYCGLALRKFGVIKPIFPILLPLFLSRALLHSNLFRQRRHTLLNMVYQN